MYIRSLLKHNFTHCIEELNSQDVSDNANQTMSISTMKLTETKSTHSRHVNRSLVAYGIFGSPKASGSLCRE